MGLFTKSTSKQTAKLKSLAKLAAARIAVVRRPRVGRRSFARGDVGQLLSIGRLEQALLRAEIVIEEDNMLQALDIVELYCKTLIEQAAQLDKPKECGEEIKEAAAGLIFASVRSGELPELLDARAILADKFGRDFAAAAKEGSHGVVDPTLVQLLSERPSLEQKRRLAMAVAVENDIWLDFPENPVEVHQAGYTAATSNGQRVQTKTEPAKKLIQEEQGRQKIAENKVNPSLAQLSVEEKVLRESEKYLDARAAAEAAFKSASFAAMAARAAVKLSQGKGPRSGGFDKAHPVVNSVGQPAPPSWGAQKSPSPSPSWSDRSTSTVTSVGSDAAHKGKAVVFDQSDEEGVAEDVAWTPQPHRPPNGYRRAATTVGGAWRGEAGSTGPAARPFPDGAAGDNPPRAHPQQHRRHATEFPGGHAHERAPHQAPPGQYVTPPYSRDPTAPASTARDGGAYESSAGARPPYAKVLSALERGHEHIARHEEVRRMGTDERAAQEKLYGAAPGQGHGPLNPERRANSVRTR